MSWVSAAEGAKYSQVVKDFVEDLKQLGPQTQVKADRS
jgi:coenzyme F420-reducing hydrogenase delta subunit